MKKLTLITIATALICSSLVANTLSVKAASPSNFLFRCGNKVIILCKPSQTLCPPAGIPDTDTPDTDTTPEIERPETEKPEVDTPENNETLSYMEQVVSLVNKERAKGGLAPLTMDIKISAAAQVRAKECEQSFSHTRPDGRNFATALKEQEVSYRRAGENIAWGQRSPEEVVNAWMSSKGHRANIMNANFTKIGVGYYQNARGTNYWCQLFTN